MPDPFVDLIAALGAGGGPPGDEIRIDGGRRRRTGAPEIVLASGKTDEQIEAAVERLLVYEPRVIVSRCPENRLDRLVIRMHHRRFDITRGSEIAVVISDNAPRLTGGGRIGVLSAGSSDISIATEAVVVAREMGCEVEMAWDVGVAGLHRLVEPLRRMIAWRPDAIIVAAGMDGVLPTIVAGLVGHPIIGLPVSTGYGHGGGGEAALATMLQTCAPGVVVVNIDNGVGAGIAAGRIAHHAASARRKAG